MNLKLTQQPCKLTKPTLTSTEGEATDVTFTCDLFADLPEVEALGLVPEALFQLARDNSNQEANEPRKCKLTLHRRIEPATWAFRGSVKGKLDTAGPDVLCEVKGRPVITVDDESIEVRLRLTCRCVDEAGLLALRRLVGADCVASTTSIQGDLLAGNGVKVRKGEQAEARA
jgi:hypothetical protein